MTGSTDFQRRVVFYRGHVQGVGFRYTAQAIARCYDVTGFVRNLSDGRVHLVAEGRASELDEFLSAVEQEMGQFIRECRVETLAPSREFDGFVIRH